MVTVIVENGRVGDIPVFCVAPAAAANAPLVFHIHSYGSSKENGLTFAYQLARVGSFVASFDAQWHGDRFDDRIFRAAEPELGGVYPSETRLDFGVAIYPAGLALTLEMECDPVAWFVTQLGL